jgi:hypothetical protein
MKESVIHAGDEFNTWDWFLDKMIKVAGFRIVHEAGETPNTKAYGCNVA